MDEFKFQLAKMYKAPTSPPPPSSDGADFLSQVTLPQLPPDFSQMLDADVTVEEVSTRIKSLKVGKRQGPDGFFTEFYKLLSSELTPIWSHCTMRLHRSNPLPMIFLIPI